MDKKTDTPGVNRREFLSTAGLLAGGLTCGRPSPGFAPDLSSKVSATSWSERIVQKRPAWWQEQGLVMAAVDWESLLPRLRAGSYDGSQAFLTYDEKIRIWQQEHSEEIARRLKDMGFNFLMIPLYKGGSLKAEQSALEEARSFTEICHRLGLRVGGYASSGTTFYESMLAEHPDAQDWFTRDQDGKYVTFEPLYYRRFVNRSHPGFRAFMRDIIRFAVEEAKVDLIHLDNYDCGPGYEPYSVQQFRKYLATKYSQEERLQRFGFAEMEYIQPPPVPPEPDQYIGDPLYRDFVDYRCEVLADTFREIAEYARSLNPEIVMEFNAGGYVGELIPSPGIGTVDHTRMLQWGGASWDEGSPSHLEDGVLFSNFRSYMLARYFDNMLFEYTFDPVAMAECMANNLQCLGCPAWVTGDQVFPSSVLYNSAARDFDPAILASIRFFHRERQFYRDAQLVADIGVLNTYANTAYGPKITRDRWAAFTQALYQGRVPFTLVPDRCPGDLSRFRVLILADLALISDELLGAVRSYVHEGGGVVLTGQATLFDEQNHRRQQAGLADLFGEALTDKILHATPGRGRAVYIPQIDIPKQFRVSMLPKNRAELLEAVRWAADRPLKIEINAPDTVAMSLYTQPTGRHILHLVNYDTQLSATDLDVTLQLPAAESGVSVRMLSPDFEGTRTLAAEQRGLALHFTIPKLTLYNLLAVE